MKRVLAIDYGHKRVGVAISDEAGLIAFPYTTIKNEGINKLISKLITIVDKEDVGTVVVGIPYHLDGNPSEQTESVKVFANKLQASLSLEVVLYDESLSTCEAHKIANTNKTTWSKQNTKYKQKGSIDKIAAAIILQDYLGEY